MGIEKAPPTYFDLSVLARSLRLASIDVIKASKTDIESQWYQSTGPVDLFFWRSKDRLVKHQMNLYGQIIEWNEFDGIKTGYIREEDLSRGKDVEVISFDKSPNSFVLEQAADFMEKVTVIDGAVKEQMLNHYKNPSEWEYGQVKMFFRRLFMKIMKKL